jgi:predicted RNA-binding protein with PUA-like domain
MAKQHWLVKSEPEAYSWTNLVTDGKTAWTGVRNFTARLNLRAMKVGDFVLFYHSVTGKEVVGIAKVAREAYPDATAEEGDWSCVDLVAHKPLKQPVTLDTLKTDEGTKDMVFIRQSRLSVSPLTDKQFARILELGGTKA